MNRVDTQLYDEFVEKLIKIKPDIKDYLIKADSEFKQKNKKQRIFRTKRYKYFEENGIF